MDLCARALLAAEQMIDDSWHARFSPNAMPAGADRSASAGCRARSTLDEAAAHALQRNVDEPPVSGQQGRLENWFNRFGG